MLNKLKKTIRELVSYHRCNEKEIVGTISKVEGEYLVVEIEGEFGKEEVLILISELLQVTDNE